MREHCKSEFLITISYIRTIFFQSRTITLYFYLLNISSHSQIIIFTFDQEFSIFRRRIETSWSNLCISPILITSSTNLSYFLYKNMKSNLYFNTITFLHVDSTLARHCSILKINFKELSIIFYTLIFVFKDCNLMFKKGQEKLVSSRQAFRFKLRSNILWWIVNSFKHQRRQPMEENSTSRFKFNGQPKFKVQIQKLKSNKSRFKIPMVNDKWNQGNVLPILFNKTMYLDKFASMI